MGAKMIKIKNFDVGKADSILLHFERKDQNLDEKKYFNLLIDGGHAKDEIREKLEEVLGEEKLHGIVVTHIDRDHISGVLDLVSRKNKLDFSNTFVLFNKYDETMISYLQAEKLAVELKSSFKEELLVKSYAKLYSVEDNKKLNSAKDNDSELSVNLMSYKQRKKYSKLDENKVNITILGPDIEYLNKFMQNWKDKIVNAEITNRSSIMILIEFNDIKVLLTGDGYIDEIKESLKQLELEKIDVIKASHHGAKENNKGLIDIVEDYKCGIVFFTITGTDDNNHPDIDLVKELYDKKCALHCSANVTGAELKKYITTKKDITIPEVGL